MLRYLSLSLSPLIALSIRKELQPNEHPLECGHDPSEDEFMGRGGGAIAPHQYWDDASITWSYAAAEQDPIAVHIDSKTGLSSRDIEVVKSAIAQIEEKTCLKFTARKPKKTEPHWLFISREGGNNGQCYQEYVTNSLGNNINGYGDLYGVIKRRYRRGRKCFSGGYAARGKARGQNLVISSATLYKWQHSYKFIAHEILHNLGISHTQKRPDAEKYITIAYDNINKRSRYNYKPESNIKTFNTIYDCMSIMHYRDTFFITDEAKKKGDKTMYPKDPATCDLSSATLYMRIADYELINKMYCSDGPKNNIIISPNFPAQYPNNTDKDYPLSVNNGYAIELKFTDFKLQPHSSCDYDWVQVMDKDGTELLPRTCGDKIPATVTSNSNQITVKFHSDTSATGSGFRAVYKRVASSKLKSGSIKSKNYPSNYPKYENKTFKIEVPSGSLIVVRFVDFYLEEDAKCRYDYVKFVERDGFVSNPLCGDQTDLKHRSTGNKLQIIFRSDRSWQYRGFNATWHEIKV